MIWLKRLFRRTMECKKCGAFQWWWKYGQTTSAVYGDVQVTVHKHTCPVCGSSWWRENLRGI